MRTGVNIRKRKDGRYEARYPKGRDAAGKLLYGYCYGHSFESQKRASIELMGSLYEPVQKPPAGSVMDF